MIFGRPVNLWLGLSTSIIGAVSVTAVVLGADPTVVATISGAWGGVVGAIVLVVANQPPTLNPGDTFKIQQPAGTPNTTGVVTPPEPVTVDSSVPAQDVQVDG
jgi:hypothetical protein